ncbi:MAG TPA: glycosyltransferase family 87 protein [Gaiellaceae bacterium]|nr:glycosyltransferase family 87 protein [Gaiellaceae bacterium]
MTADGTLAFDFRPFYRAAGAILQGETPYPAADDPLTATTGAYVYPPLGALLSIPFRAAPFDVAGVVVMVLLTASAVAIPYVLGVRDWRCFGVVFLWPPIWSATQTGNMTLFLGLAAAVAWRYRDLRVASSAVVGVTLAAKFFLWPLVVWFAATRRVWEAVTATVIGALLLVVSWAAIGFVGLVDYPDLMRRLQSSIGEQSFTLYIVGLDLGLPSPFARGICLALGLGLLAAVVLAGRRGDERSAFIFAVAAALTLSPIVWLHYFALLLLVVALAQPTLGVIWFVPLAMVVTPGSGHPTPFETAATLGIATLTIALALRTTLWPSEPQASRPPGRPFAPAASES